MPPSRQPETDSLKEYQKWREQGFDLPLQAYALWNMTPDMLIALSKVFWPDFVVRHGGIFWADRYSEERFNRWMKVTGGDLTAVEQVYNHTHLEFFLQHLSEPLSDQNFEYLQAVLVQMWRAAMKAQFPDHRVLFDSTKQDSGDYIITFWTKRD